MPKKITDSEDNEFLFQVKVSFHMFSQCVSIVSSMNALMPLTSLHLFEYLC